MSKNEIEKKIFIIICKIYSLLLKKSQVPFPPIFLLLVNININLEGIKRKKMKWLRKIIRNISGSCCDEFTRINNYLKHDINFEKCYNSEEKERIFGKNPS